MSYQRGHNRKMTSIESSSGRAWKSLFLAASIAIAGLALTACSPTPSTDRTVTMHVNGAQNSALVKAIVVTGNGKESGGEMQQRSLPYTQEVSLPADTTLTKVLVIAKYPSGATDNISCTVTIDGNKVAAKTSTSHQPAECLFVETGTP